ncbi:IS256 family transposase [Amycolatopsis sp. lyj-84]|uniref:IS256 family transposase n=1 Tax=Amycolatopsis sp. lyj-84 TaxID=2789284 RepID=UPI00397ACD43
MSPRKSEFGPARDLSPEQAAAAAMVAEAKARGLALTGPDGLLKLFTKNVLETALNEEMAEHLGHEKNQAEPDRESTNVRNGTRPKTVVSDAAGEVDINVPRDRESTFEPRIVKKRQRRLTEVDEIVLSLYAKGMTTGDISAHFAEIYGTSVSKETISRITDKVIAEMQDWASRPLDAVYVAVFIDAIHVKVRDGQVANRPVYAAIGVTVDGCKDVFGLWMGTGGEGAKFWMSVLIDLKNRGVRDVFFLVCDGLKGLPEVVKNVWPQTIVQTCIVHLIRNTFRLASRRDWDAVKRDIKPIYTAPDPDAAMAALDELEEKWGAKYRAMIRLWRNAWNEFVPFLDYDIEIRRMICSTNAIESLNARYRRAIRARGHFPTEQAAMKCLYLVTRSLDPTGAGRARWMMRWKPVINAFAITFGDRCPGAETY